MSSPQDSKVDFAQRRKTFLNEIGKGVAVFCSLPEFIRNNDVHYAYRQNSNLFYLTGFKESDAIGLFAPESDNAFQMFVHPKDKTKEMWEGFRLGPERAKAVLGANATGPSIPDTAFDEAFIAAMLTADKLYYRLGVEPNMDRRILGLLARAMRKLGRTGRPLWPILDPDEVLGEMRVIKSKAEIERLARAGEISAQAHQNAMRITKPGMYEFQIEAALFHAFRGNGAERLGYESIVASGPNACVLHYRENDRRMADGDLLLIDAGGEYEFYTADITRTFPVSGRYTDAQKDVYQAVLDAQKSCIKLARPGKTMREIHEHAIEVLTEKLRELKVLKGPTASLIKKKEFHPYYPHGTGHWLGMDVHDIGRYYQDTYDRPRKFQPGMCLTIEPGLYFGLDSKAPARFKGIGVRIEDDIVITPTGCKVLTSSVPKEIEEVEALCSEAG
ncbi:aminopeptidase P N-terminal domain-containing protein [bacterium]|nr:aminopeptidase P N-terminal domain-containing protein [bacterium]